MVERREDSKDRQHPQPEILERFLLGSLEAASRSAVVAHLIAGCDSCRAEMAPLTASLFGGHRAEPTPERAERRDAYDIVLQRVFDRVLLHEMRGRRRRWAVERAKKEQARDVKAPDVARYSPYATFEACLARSWSLRHEDPQEMLSWAERAVFALGGIDPQRDPFSQRQLADLTARALGEYANALRINEQFERAAQILDWAFTAHQRGTGEGWILCRLAGYLASLLAAQHHYLDARDCMEDLERAYRELGDPAMVAYALVKKAIYTGHAGDCEAALRLLDVAAPIVDSETHPRLVSQALQNRLYFLVETGRLEEAYSILTTQRALLLDGAPAVERGKLAFLEGRLMALSGQDDLAEPLLRGAREMLARRTGVALPAVVDLHLSSLCLRRQRMQEAFELAGQAARAFGHLRLRDSRLEALRALQRARQP
jgi:tetratricopeptide (TPR) repeat protein